MSEDKFSCIKQVIKTVQIAIPSTFITNEFAGVTEVLDSWKRQYVKQVNGIVVNYRNISVISRTGYIGVVKSIVHYNVKATFDLFCPKVGDVVKGKINRMSREHIGCLVQGTINVTIHLSEETSSELTQFLYLNRDVLFEILHYDFERKMIRVTGSITPKCIQLMKDLFPPENFCPNVTSSNHIVYNFDEGIGSNSENSDDKSNLIMDVSTVDHNAVGNDANFKIPLSKESDAETVVADFSKPKKTKSPKKRKRETESSTLDTSDLSTADEMPKKKKRRKDKIKPLSEKEVEVKDDLLLNGPTETLGCGSFIEKHNDVNHTDILGSIKIEVSSPKKKTPDSSHIEKKKKKKKQESSPSLSGESSSPKKKKKRKDKGLGDSDKKAKGKDKKSKSKKTKGKLLSSGKVLKKDKKPHKSKDSKKIKKLDGEQSKKHKSGKSHKKDKNEKKKSKKKDISNNENVSTAIKSEFS